ncbi:MAG: hypothetical protein SH808_07710 [Saprospiraceae bacterium]|nr:hypothetical protein [Saprospiraceae bacterium]
MPTSMMNGAYIGTTTPLKQTDQIHLDFKTPKKGELNSHDRTFWTAAQPFLPFVITFGWFGTSH